MPVLVKAYVTDTTLMSSNHGLQSVIMNVYLNMFNINEMLQFHMAF